MFFNINFNVIFKYFLLRFFFLSFYLKIPKVIYSFTAMLYIFHCLKGYLLVKMENFDYRFQYKEQLEGIFFFFFNHPFAYIYWLGYIACPAIFCPVLKSTVLMCWIFEHKIKICLPASTPTV